MAKILAVDDDTAILDMIGTILNKDGHLVTKVSNPLEINMEKVNLYDLILKILSKLDRAPSKYELSSLP